MMPEESKYLIWIVVMTMVLFGIFALLFTEAADAHEDLPGRWLDAGNWNGVIACEAGPNNHHGTPHMVPHHHPLKRSAEVRADSRGHTPDLGVVQFIEKTWNNVSSLRGAHWLVGRDPRTVTLAEQMRNAQWLRTNVGIFQWSCGYRYGDGTGPRWVTGVWKESPHPRKCARNLHRHHGFKWSVAASICNYKQGANNGR